MHRAATLVAVAVSGNSRLRPQADVRVGIDEAGNDYLALEVVYLGIRWSVNSIDGPDSDDPL